MSDSEEILSSEEGKEEQEKGEDEKKDESEAPKKKKKIVVRKVVRKKKKKPSDDTETPESPSSPTVTKKKKKKIIRRVVRKKKKKGAPSTPVSKLKTSLTTELFPDTPPTTKPNQQFPDVNSDSEEDEDEGEEEKGGKTGKKKKKVTIRKVVGLSAKKKKELEELQKVCKEEVNERVDGLLGEMRAKQKPLMTKTLKKMNEHMYHYMKTVIKDVTEEVRDFQIMQKMAELAAREQKIHNKELELLKREKKIKKKEQELKEKEEDLGKYRRKNVKVEMGVCAQEYMDIEDHFATIDQGHFSIGREPDNLFKNRYSNILPYNHTLVRLPSKKYLNASHIDFYGLKFIGCQWPLDNEAVNTEEEFWEMCYEQDVHVVVALQKPKPPKHHYYFPREKGETKACGKFSVYHKSKIVHPFFQVVTCLVKKGGGKVKETMKGLKEVKLCLFLTWPDHDIPTKQHPLFAMIKTARLMNIDISRAAHERREFPIVVHCSAGVGRTGVYILCDVAIQKNFGVDKVKEILIEMRKQRYGMIQTAKQYKYVYDLVNQYATEE